MLYTKEFAQKVRLVFALQRIRVINAAGKKDEDERKTLCLRDGKNHDYDKYVPFLGCKKYVCRKCFIEQPGKCFRPGVNARKGRTFAFTKKNRPHAGQEIQC